MDGENVAAQPLAQRLERLRSLLATPAVDARVLKFTDYIVGEGPRVLEEACRLGVEGIVAKRLSAPYQPGRSKSWLKIKCPRRSAFVVGGYTEPGGERPGLGALLVGYYEDDDRLRYAGSVGTGQGFTQDFLRELREQLTAFTQDESPFWRFAPTTVSSPWGSRRPRRCAGYDRSW